MDLALNVRDIAEISGKDITMIPYTDMHLYKSIKDVFATNYVVLNYLTSKNYGHWVCMCKQGNKITFFDSYGKLPDDQLEFIPIKYRIESNQDYPYLVALLKKWSDKGGEVHYNSEQFQKYSSMITTCGRWVGYFLRYCDSVSVEDFEHKMESARNAMIRGGLLKDRKDIDMFYDKLIVDLTKKYIARY